MTQKNKKKDGTWQRVEIHWLDSVSIRISGKSWHTYQEVKAVMDSTDCLVTTGYKFEDNKDYVAVAMSMTMQDGMPVLFGDPMLIPKGCIKSIKIK